jgi:hypothetical protein
MNKEEWDIFVIWFTATYMPSNRRRADIDWELAKLEVAYKMRYQELKELRLRRSKRTKYQKQIADPKDLRGESGSAFSEMPEDTDSNTDTIQTKDSHDAA